MNISATPSSSASGVGDSGTASQIARIQKQIQTLTNELKDLATSDMNAKAKIARSTLLQAMIQMLQQQIAALQQAQAVKQLQAASDKAQAAQPGKSTAAARNPVAGLGESVDTYA
jgi:DNA repair exonuclease SbcCD ATPase subunit